MTLTPVVPVLAREGYPLIIGASTVAFIVVALALLFQGWTWVFGIAGLVAHGVTIWFFRDPAQRLPIAASPLNLYVDRPPISGVIEFEQYVPGDYFVAWHPKPSSKNERSEIGARHTNGTPVFFELSAGAIAGDKEERNGPATL